MFPKNDLWVKIYYITYRDSDFFTSSCLHRHLEIKFVKVVLKEWTKSILIECLYVLWSKYWYPRYFWCIELHMPVFFFFLWFHAMMSFLICSVSSDCMQWAVWERIRCGFIRMRICIVHVLTWFNARSSNYCPQTNLRGNRNWLTCFFITQKHHTKSITYIHIH